MAFSTIDYYLFDAEAQRKYVPTPQAGGTLSVLDYSFTLTTAANATGIVSRVLWVPSGFRLWGFGGNIADVDSATGLVWDLGDSGDQDRIIAASTVGRSAGQLNSDDIAVAGMGYQYTANTDILLTVTTGATTPVAGTWNLALLGQMA